jgi:hypothetical protein
MRPPATIVRISLVSVCACVIGAASPHPTCAQIISGRRPEVTQGLTYLSWKITGDTDLTVSQLYIPLVVRAGLRDNLELAVFTAGVRSAIEHDGTTDDLAGLADSRIQLAASFLHDRLVVSAGVSLPTGKTELEPAEELVIPWLTSDFLNFPVKSPGEGFNLFGQVGVAVSLGSWVFGASTAVYAAGEYTPYAETQSYRPGSRLLANVGIERRWEKRYHVIGDLVVVYSTDDKLAGKAVFRDGMQYDARVQGTATFGAATFTGSVRGILRDEDKRPGGSSALVSEVNNRNGSDLRFNLYAAFRMSSALSLWLSGESKILAANSYPPDDPFYEGAARIAGFGGGMDIHLSPRATFGVGARAWNGSSDGTLGLDHLDLSGLEITQRLSVSL